VIVGGEFVDEHEDASSDEEEGVWVERMRYPSYPVYPVYGLPSGGGQLSDTVFRLEAKTTRTTKVFGIPVVKRIVEASDSQDWRGH
jgi:hypothetical protein